MTQYRQITQRLRLQMGPGRPDIESERPRNTKTGRYLDLGPDGKSTTLVEIPDDAQPSPTRLLKMGAIEALPPAAVSARNDGGIAVVDVGTDDLRADSPPKKGAAGGQAAS